jgi:hypothetical protein
MSEELGCRCAGTQLQHSKYGLGPRLEEARSVIDMTGGVDIAYACPCRYSVMIMRWDGMGWKQGPKPGKRVSSSCLVQNCMFIHCLYCRASTMAMAISLRAHPIDCDGDSLPTVVLCWADDM